MWPWEHLALGYLVYALARRAVSGRGPTGADTVVLGIGTQLPDLIDKPLAWTFDVLPSGTTLAHSLFVAAPLSIAALALAARRGRPWIGVAFATGYLLHLPADALYGTVTNGEPPTVGVMLWPLVSRSPSPGRGFVEQFFHYLSAYREYLSSPEATTYVAFEVVLLGSVLALWIYDGAPPVGELLSDARSTTSTEP